MRRALIGRWRWRWTGLAGLLGLAVACRSSSPPAPRPTQRSDQVTGPAVDASGLPPARSPADTPGQLFARAHHLDVVLGRTKAAEKLYRRAVDRKDTGQRLRALVHLRLAELCQLRKDRHCALTELDQVILHAARHPELARQAEVALVGLLHPQAGRSSALKRGPRVGFTSLQGVPLELERSFRRAEKRLLGYVRVPLTLQIHNYEEVLRRKRGALVTAVRSYEPLLKAQSPNAVAAGLFRQGSLYQDYAELLGRVRVPGLLPRLAAKLRAQIYAESVAYLKLAVERYRKAMAVKDVAAERWRRAAARAEAQLSRAMPRRRAGG